MNTIMIDTDVLINFLRGKEKARDFMSSFSDAATICCSVITVAEIIAGMRENERKETERLIDSLNILDVTREIAEKAGSYKNRIKTHTLELDDCIIAATAFIQKAVLATGNGKHYPMTDIKKSVVFSE